MNLSTSPPSLLSPAPASPLPAELVDAITDAVVLPIDPATRSVAVSLLVHEIYASVAWLGDTLAEGELISLQRIIDGAEAHHAWADQHAEPTTTPNAMAS